MLLWWSNKRIVRKSLVVTENVLGNGWHGCDSKSRHSTCRFWRFYDSQIFLVSVISENRENTDVVWSKTTRSSTSLGKHAPEKQRWKSLSCGKKIPKYDILHLRVCTYLEGIRERIAFREWQGLTREESGHSRWKWQRRDQVELEIRNNEAHDITISSHTSFLICSLFQDWVYGKGNLVSVQMKAKC